MKVWIRRLLIMGALFSTGAFANGTSVQVSEGYVRGVPQSSEVTAAYMKISNSTSSPIRLVSAQSDGAESVEFHEHSRSNGMMKMRQLATVNVPANGSVTLEPMGIHVMLIGLKHQFFDKKTVKLSLRFSDGQTQELVLPIKRLE